MDSERRYGEREVAQIFERATKSAAVEPRPGAPAGGDGLTLAQLQEIGREVGVPAEAIADAARSVGIVAAARRPRWLGLPIGVERTVDLGRRLGDEEWERLVIDLRETFDARGIMHSDGSFRQWTNGNLQALLEPTETGHRLRLRTLKGSARRLMGTGLALLGSAGAVVFGHVLAGGIDAGVLHGISFLALSGAGVFAAGVLQVPAWARRRGAQMEEIASRVARGDRSSTP